jgi:4-amino-4-deoxy-L-arabinose transferase-like glycosyltransferase
MRTAGRWQVNLALLLILVVGFLVRAYNLDFPSVGYHNMAENESLCIAQEMQDSGRLSFKQVYFYNAFLDDPAIKNDGKFPLIPYQILLSWKLFGENLWGARLFNIFFGLLSILVIYLIASLFFKEFILSLFCASLVAVMPLAVFFSRNLQPETPAFFFMLLGSLFYLKFCFSLKKYNLLLGGLFFSCSWAYRNSFLFGLLPFAFCLPFGAMIKKKESLWKYLLSLIAPYLAVISFFLWTGVRYHWLKPGGFHLSFSNALKAFTVFSPSYWAKYGSIIFWYAVNENYTPVLSILALLGIILAFLRARELLDRYIIGWVLTALVFAMAFKDTLYQQGFCQMPFLLLVCLACAQVIIFASDALRKNAAVFLAAATLITALPFAYSSLSRMYGTVFFGEDVAGGSIKELTAPDERVLLFSHSQGAGIARYAQRFMGWPADLEDLRAKEAKFKIRYICVYPSEYLLILKRDSPQVYKYMEENYHFKELGLMEEPDQLVYFILEKGKGEKFEEYLKKIRAERRPRSIYRLFSRYIFFYTLRPAG